MFRTTLSSGCNCYLFHNPERELGIAPFISSSLAFHSHPRCTGGLAAHSFFACVFCLSVLFISYPMHARQISFDVHPMLVPTETFSSHREMLLQFSQLLSCAGFGAIGLSWESGRISVTA